MLSRICSEIKDWSSSVRENSLMPNQFTNLVQFYTSFGGYDQFSTFRTAQRVPWLRMNDISMLDPPSWDVGTFGHERPHRLTCILFHRSPKRIENARLVHSLEADILLGSQESI